MIMANVLHATQEEFSNIMKERGIVFVDFYANWCGPCKMLAPEVEKLAELYQGKIKVLKIDVDKEPELAGRYGVQSIPTMMVFKDGKIMARELGYRPFQALKSMIDQFPL